ncbi:MAG: DUF2163 domain-containing protein [Sphingomonadaceae bacterium]|nr:DUF2163 domain-containing protein [Sphingomonadaceae bacterium]
MAIWLEGPVTSVAYGWRLERRDGVTIGFTSHDRDVVQAGLVLRASPGMRPTSIVETLGLEDDGPDIDGALTADAISADDLRTGRWDGAYLEIFLFDWTDPDAGRQLLATGELGAISFTGDAFKVEFLGLKQAFNREIAPSTSPSCRAVFADASCGLNRQRFRHLARVAAVNGNRLIFANPVSVPVDAFAYGHVRMLDGAYAGLTLELQASDASGVTLAERPGFAIEPATSVELVEGCDKQISTCGTRFANAVNFRGEPYLPGNDLLTRYPGAN